MGKAKSLYQLQMKYQRASVKEVHKLSENTELFLQSNYEADNKNKTGDDYELETLAGIWAFVAENIERDKWKSYTREDWEELERQHVERADYTEPDLFDDIMTAYESGGLTADEARARAQEYHKCKYRFCLNVFEPRRRDQWYCDADCRKREANAKIRYERTGTYLPAEAYKDNRDDTERRNYEEMEVAVDMQENIEMLERHKRKDEQGGIRDRQREAYYLQKVTEKDLKDSQETALKRHCNPVTNEEERAVV